MYCVQMVAMGRNSDNPKNLNAISAMAKFSQVGSITNFRVRCKLMNTVKVGRQGAA